MLLLVAPLWGGGPEPPKQPLSFTFGRFHFQPSGFLDLLSVYHNHRGPESVSTNFGAIRLGDPPADLMVSVRHSRLALETSAGALTAYIESDFLDSPGRQAYRFRHYWGQYRLGKWKVLAGQAWSLLRPSRTGVSPYTDQMNTIVVEPAYHVGLAGFRKPQIRLTRDFGNYHAVVAYEYKKGGDFVAKFARDGRWFHGEAVALAGHGGRRGAGLAGVLRAGPRVTLVSQQFWSQGVGPDLVGGIPAGVHAQATISGVEAKLTARLQMFWYGGLVYGTRSPGNRLVREWTAGFHQKLSEGHWYGTTFLSAQLSQIDRALWAGPQGSMTYIMVGFRHFMPPRY